jgi:CRP/FNR family transcriptional regulator, cyclic AMP receptor protein
VVLTTMVEELADHRFFRLMPSELRLRLAGCAKNVVFEPSARLCTEGTRATGFFAIRSGRVNVGLYVPHRGLQVLETRHAGDVIGYSWLFPPYRWQIDAVAAERVRAVELHADCMLPYLEENPSDGYLLARMFAQEMQEHIQSAQLRLLDVYGRDYAGSR